MSESHEMEEAKEPKIAQGGKPQEDEADAPQQKPETTGNDHPAK
jgi:hypothetical protein